MIIEAGSPLRRLPTGMDRAQAHFLDGIRLSIEILDLAHQRLRQTLIAMSDRSNSLGRGVGVPLAMSDAWTIIDLLHRLSGLLQQVPKLKDRNRCPSFRRLIQDESIETLRNAIQHLNQDIRKRSDLGWPVLGVLGWAKFEDDRQSAVIGMLRAGHMTVNTTPIVNPLGRMIHDHPIGCIELRIESAVVQISDVMETVKEIAADLEHSLEGTFSQFPERAPTDFLSLLGIKFPKADSAV